MNLSQFFINRPIFAAVLSLLILIGGLLALPNLPISEYPEVVPPTVVVRANFPGANPKTIAETVATPLEEQINGVEQMLYMSSQATSDGALQLTITFALGTDLDKAQVQVQNRVAQALPKLPEEVQRLGITTNKSSPDLTLVVHLLSPAGRPLAITADLSSFWQQAYPEVRKQMRGRYPRHPWPDDPLNAVPTARAKPRGAP